MAKLAHSVNYLLDTSERLNNTELASLEKECGQKIRWR